MEPASSPSLSVVIPSRDRPEILHRTLRVLLAEKSTDAELPPFEVVVVDDGSTEPLHEGLSAFEELAELDQELDDVAQARLVREARAIVSSPSSVATVSQTPGYTLATIREKPPMSG